MGEREDIADISLFFLFCYIIKKSPGGDDYHLLKTIQYTAVQLVHSLQKKWNALNGQNQKRRPKDDIRRIFNAEVVFERSITNANLILMAGDTASGQSTMNYCGYLS